MSCSTDVFSVMVPTTLPWLSMSTPLVLGRLSFACLPATAASGQQPPGGADVRDFHPGRISLLVGGPGDEEHAEEADHGEQDDAADDLRPSAVRGGRYHREQQREREPAPS